MNVLRASLGTDWPVKFDLREQGVDVKPQRE